jgi:hypothetical protein
MKHNCNALYLLDERSIPASFESITLFLGNTAIVSSTEEQPLDIDTIASKLSTALGLPIVNIEVTSKSLAKAIANNTGDQATYEQCIEEEDEYFKPLIQGYSGESLALLLPEQP